MNIKIKKIITYSILILSLLLSTFSLASCNKKDNKNLNSYILCEQMNDFIHQIKSDGTFEEIKSIWFGNDESKKIIDKNLTGENGKITFASCLTTLPMGYYKDGEEAGLSTDLIYRFAKKYGYSLEFFDTSNPNSCIAAVLSGKADFGGTHLSITEERQKTGCFSDPYYDNQLLVLTSNDTAAHLDSIEELDGQPWGCYAGSTYSEYIAQKMPHSEISEYSSEVEALTELSLGRVKAVILDSPAANYIANTNVFPNLCIYSQFFDYHDQYGFFFPKFASQSLDDYSNKKIANVIGSVGDQFLKGKLPDAEVYYYETTVDCCAALSNQKVDAYVDETASFIYNKKNNPANLYQIPEKLGESEYGFIFPKNDEGFANCNDFNTFLETLKLSGKLEELTNKWLYDSDNATCEVDYRTLQGNEVLHVQTVGQFPPFSYVKGDKLEGLEIDIISLYAKSRHKKLDITLNSFPGLLSSSNRDDFDIAFSMICYSEERAKTFYFSDPYYEFDIILVTYIAGTNIPFKDRIANSFKSTFITEQRWKLLLSGLVETLIITVLSILFGTIIGFGVFLIINRSKYIRKILKIIDYIVNGMPTVVFLMIVYYDIFSKSSLSGSAIAVGTFTLLFASCVVKALIISVGGVNENQIESAMAFGYTHTHALFRFVLPQARSSFLKIYKGDAINLLKSTAIVGYIAVQDLTKVSDIVRSRTFEAIFPLITLGIVYFLLTYLISLLLSRIEIRTNPKHRKKLKILEGVNQDENRN